MTSTSVDVVANNKLSSFYGWAVFHCIHALNFLYSWSHEHLDYSHFLAIFLSTAINWRVKLVNRLLSSHVTIYPIVGLLDHMLVLFSGIFFILTYSFIYLKRQAIIQTKREEKKLSTHIHWIILQMRKTFGVAGMSQTWEQRT